MSEDGAGAAAVVAGGGNGAGARGGVGAGVGVTGEVVGAGGGGGALPAVYTALSGEEIVRRLDQAARRGRLPGFSAGGRGGALFEVKDFGTPCEGVLRGRLVEKAQSEERKAQMHKGEDHSGGADSGPAGEIRFDVRMQPLVPVVMLVVLVLTVWPGVWLMESAIASFFPSSQAWKWTAWWYLPITILSVPWAMWVLIRRSRMSIDEGARELVGKIRDEVAE